MSSLKHFTRISDLGVDGLAEVLERAIRWKQADPGHVLSERVLGMVFFNPSLRTRTSFEAAMLRGGGGAVVLQVGQGMWKLEERTGVVMDGDRAEHLREAVPVLARYVDGLAVRTFAGLEDGDLDERDPVMSGFREYSTVPVINMESGREHPCQGLADVMTLKERFGDLRGLPVTLSWAPHVKPLPLAVPQSFVLSAAAAGCRVQIAHPEGYDLNPRVLGEARELAAQAGGEVVHCASQRDAVRDSVAVYAKSWAPMSLMPDRQAALQSLRANRDWLITRKLMESAGGQPIFLHCLPIRRNVVAEDAVLDHVDSAVVDEAENRFHVQRAILAQLL